MGVLGNVLPGQRLLIRCLLLLFYVTQASDGPAKLDMSQTMHMLAEDYEPPQTADSIVLSPTVINFPASQLFVPQIVEVDIINPMGYSIRLRGVTCNRTEFQIGHLKKVEIPSRHLYRVPIVFLPTQVGKTDTHITFSTEDGMVRVVRVRGQGTPNIYKVRSLSNITIPIDTGIAAPISIYNPLKSTYKVKEVFTTERFLHLRLPETPGKEGKPSTAMLWEIKPREQKRIIDLTFQSSIPGLFIGFIHIRTQDVNMIVPIQIKVLKESVNLRPTQLNFGVLTFRSQKRARTLELQNLGMKPVVVEGFDWELDGENDGVELSVQYPDGMVIPAQGRWTASITMEYGADTKTADPVNITGAVMLGTNLTNFSVPFHASFLHGTLAYSRNSVLFRMPPLSVKTKSLNEGCPADGYLENNVVLTNRFPQPVKVVNVSLAHPSFEVAADPAAIDKVARPGEQWSLCKLRFKPTARYFGRTSMHTSLRVATNISVFNMAIQAFDGAFEVYEDSNAPGAIRYVSGDSRKLQSLISSRPRPLAVGRTSVVHLVLNNPNPVDLHLTRAKASERLVQVRAVGQAAKKGARLPVVIPAKESIPLILNVTSSVPVKDKVVRITLHAEIPFFSNHACASVRRPTRLVFPFRFALIKGTLDWAPSVVALPPAYPGMVSTSVMHVTNRYEMPIRVASVKTCWHEDGEESFDECITDERFSVRIFKRTLPPMEKIKFGEIVFDPAKVVDEDNYMLPVSDQDKGGPTKAEMDRLDSVAMVWERLNREKSHKIKRTISFDFGILGSFSVPVRASLSLPRILDEQMDFGAVQVNTSRTLFLHVNNPTSEPLRLSLVSIHPSSASQDSSDATSSNHDGAGEKDNPFSLDPATMATEYVVQPGDELEVGPVQFCPRRLGDYSGVLYVRNNLTQLSKVNLRARSTNQTLFFDMVPEDDDPSGSDSAPGASGAHVPTGVGGGPRQSIEHEGYVYHLMPLESTSPKSRATHFWRLSMYNGGEDDVIVTGLSVGNSSCATDGHVSTPGDRSGVAAATGGEGSAAASSSSSSGGTISSSGGSSSSNSSPHIKNCNLLPLQIGPGNSASFRVSTNGGLDRRVEGGSLLQPVTSLNSLLWPLAEHHFLVSTATGDHRLLLTVPLAGPGERIQRMLGGVGSEGYAWQAVTLLLTILTLGVTVKLRASSSSRASVSMSPVSKEKSAAKKSTSTSTREEAAAAARQQPPLAADLAEKATKGDLKRRKKTRGDHSSSKSSNHTSKKSSKERSKHKKGGGGSGDAASTASAAAQAIHASQSLQQATGKKAAGSSSNNKENNHEKETASAAAAEAKSSTSSSKRRRRKSRDKRMAKGAGESAVSSPVDAKQQYDQHHKAKAGGTHGTGHHSAPPKSGGAGSSGGGGSSKQAHKEARTKKAASSLGSHAAKKAAKCNPNPPATAPRQASSPAVLSGASRAKSQTTSASKSSHVSHAKLNGHKGQQRHHANGVPGSRSAAEALKGGGPPPGLGKQPMPRGGMIASKSRSNPMTGPKATGRSPNRRRFSTPTGRKSNSPLLQGRRVAAGGASKSPSRLEKSRSTQGLLGSRRAGRNPRGGGGGSGVAPLPSKPTGTSAGASKVPRAPQTSRLPASSSAAARAERMLRSRRGSGGPNGLAGGGGSSFGRPPVQVPSDAGNHGDPASKPPTAPPGLAAMGGPPQGSSAAAKPLIGQSSSSQPLTPIGTAMKPPAEALASLHIPRDSSSSKYPQPVGGGGGGTTGSNGTGGHGGGGVIYQPRLGGFGSLGLHDFSGSNNNVIGGGIPNHSRTSGGLLSNRFSSAFRQSQEHKQGNGTGQWGSGFSTPSGSQQGDQIIMGGGTPIRTDSSSSSTRLFGTTPVWGDNDNSAPGFASRPDSTTGTPIWASSSPAIWGSQARTGTSQWGTVGQMGVSSSLERPTVRTTATNSIEKKTMFQAENPAFFDFLDTPADSKDIKDNK